MGKPAPVRKLIDESTLRVAINTRQRDGVRRAVEDGPREIVAPMHDNGARRSIRARDRKRD